MTKMRIATLLLMLFVSFQVIQARSKGERRIYLWDVTLSMKGYGGAENIYDKVRDDLKKAINDLHDETTEITVILFQHKILDEWQVNATVSGKKDILNKIDKYSNNDTTRTNICQPLEYVLNKKIAEGKVNVLYLMTDGLHNESPKQDLINLLQKWCSRYAGNNDVFAFYVMLTEAAVDTDISNIIKNCQGFELVSPGHSLHFLDLLPTSDEIRYNLKDDGGKPVTVNFTSVQSISEYPENIKIHVKTGDSNPYININEVVSLTDRKISFDINPVISADLPETLSVTLYLEIENREEIEKYNVSLFASTIDLILINKREKTLKIHVRDEK
jgi:hypothetical protein